MRLFIVYCLSSSLAQTHLCHQHVCFADPVRQHWQWGQLTSEEGAVGAGAVGRSSVSENAQNWVKNYTILGRISGPGPCWMTAWVILHFLNLCLLIWEIKTGLHTSQECHTLKWYNYGRCLVKSRDSLGKEQWVGSSFWGQKKKQTKKKTVNPVPESKEPRWKQPGGGER